MRGRLRHVLALLLFAAATVLWMWPFVAAPAAVIPGDGAGDNFLFVWNYWWARHSLLAGASPLWCPALFVPFGVDLTLDTHTLLPTTIAGLFVQDALAGTNAIIGVHLFLNFATAYALAWWMTRDWPSSLLASVILGCSPYVGERLLGHFNLIAVWVFPLVGLLTLRAFDGTRRDSVLLGIAMAAVAYLEYYYVVYAAVMVATFVAARVVRLETRAVTGAWQRRTVGALAVLVIASSAVGALVRLTGGTVLHIGGAPISLRSAGNPLAAAWLLGLTALIVALAPRMRPRLDRAALAASGRQIGTAAGVAIILTLPLLAAGARVWMNGDYVSQHYLWRSAPKGIDVATMLAGNPRGVLWHDGPADLYRRWNVDTIEQTAWMPPAVVCLCVIALWLRRRDRSLRLWLWAAAVFLIWALGPYVVAFGRTLPLPLPGILVRYVPLIANARVPSRAIAVVYAASAVFAAAGLAALRERGRRGWALALSALAIVDLLPSTPPVFTVERPPVYDSIRQRPEDGAVCELPMGLRDSFGEVGRFDSLVLWHQTLHGRPMTGGFISRLPPRIAAAYQASPVFGPLLRLSAGEDVGTLPGRDAALAAIEQAGVRFLVIDRTTSPVALIAFVRTLNLPRIGGDDRHDVFLVTR